MITVEYVESILNTLLQRNLSFQINKKIIKQGKLVLFSVKDYYITFFIKVGSLQKKYEVPYPFNVIHSKLNNNHKVVFDYNVDVLAPINSDLYLKLKNTTTKTSKLCNVKLDIIEESK